MKKSFTINCNRTLDDFNGYKELIKKNIYQGIEIFFPYNVKEEQKDFYTSELKQLKKEFPNLEFVMHLPHGPINSLTTYNKETINRMIAAIHYSAIFEIKKLTLHLGSVDKSINRNDYLEENSPFLNNICEVVLEASKYNMNVMIENMPADNEYGYSPAEILNIINKVDSITKTNNIKFILDTGHANVSSYDILEYVKLLKDYLYHLHYNDNYGERDEHKRMGLGNIDFYKFMETLKEIDYSELHCMEVIFKEYKELIGFANDLDRYNKVDL